MREIGTGASPAAHGDGTSRAARSGSDGGVISLDTMRDAMMANFEPEDLDVPAFLRKRSRGDLG